MLSPLDIHNKEFKRALRGYAEAEVDEFLDQMVRDFEQLLRENSLHRSKVEEHEERLERYRSLEETLQNTLVVAQSTAEEVKAAAGRQAEVIVQEAKAEAHELKTAAAQKVRQMEQEMEELRKEMVHFKARMKAMLKSYLEFLEYEKVEEGASQADKPES